MKKIILMAFAFSAMLATSCEKEEEKKVEPPKQEEPAEKSKLFNNWQCTAINVEGSANITGAPIGTFTATGFDLSDFEVNFIEASKAVTKSGNYSLNVKLNTSAVPINETTLTDQVIFPTGTFVENNDGTITIKTGTEDVVATILENTDTKLQLKALLKLEYEITQLSSTVSLPSNATFTFKKK
ncbi:MAG: hypothetical protein N4A45_06700 [Flavobacteriales bacterium]|nr:hypothetical protein [Flavobacteriales bacterium]